MKVASSFELETKHLLRLRASQRYQYANIDKNDKSNKKEDVTVRDKNGFATYDLYEKYILTPCKYKEITNEDQRRIRDLAIALLKYDFIKRGDNDNLRYFKSKREREKDYKEL